LPTIDGRACANLVYDCAVTLQEDIGATAISNCHRVELPGAKVALRRQHRIVEEALGSKIMPITQLEDIVERESRLARFPPLPASLT